MADTDKKPRKRNTRPRPTRAVEFTVWNANGGPLPEDAVKEIEAAIERTTFELFNKGIRVLTQTNRA